jgi:hypothetical protein
MGLDTSDLHDLVLAYPQLHASDLSKQGQYHCRRWGRCRAFVSWDLLLLDAQRETDLALDDAVDEQPDDREHRQGGNPFRLLEPHRLIAAGFLGAIQQVYRNRNRQRWQPKRSFSLSVFFEERH